jgi:hypothetical protein
VQWRLDFQNDAPGARCDERYVATELDRIAKTLLGVVLPVISFDPSKRFSSFKMLPRLQSASA